eukprot:1511739-Rhodomonas_salina.1
MGRSACIYADSIAFDGGFAAKFGGNTIKDGGAFVDSVSAGMYACDAFVVHFMITNTSSHVFRTTCARNARMVWSSCYAMSGTDVSHAML